MDLATRLKTAKENAEPRPLREYLRGRLLEFQRTGRTSITTRDQYGNTEKKEIKDPQTLMLTMLAISRASKEVYVSTTDGADIRSYQIGDVIHQFRVGQVLVDVAINVETSDPERREHPGFSSLEIKRDGNVELALLGLFVERLRYVIEFLEEPLRKAGIEDPDQKLNVTAYHETIGYLLQGRAIEKGVTDVRLIGQLGPAAFTTHPVLSVLDIFHRSRGNSELVSWILHLLGISNESELVKVPELRIKTILQLFANATLAQIGCPPLNSLVSTEEVEQLKTGIFG